jgi:hypothetical protein
VDVIMLTTEDDERDTIKPRLMAAGADCQRVHIFRNIIRKDDRDRTFMLNEDIELLEDAIERIRNVGLVTIDPITGVMGGKLNPNSVTDVRSQLNLLKNVAEHYGVVMWVITHPPKAAGDRAYDQYIGSQAFIAAARIGHLCTPEYRWTADGPKRETGRKFFTIAGSNISATAALKRHWASTATSKVANGFGVARKARWCTVVRGERFSASSLRVRPPCIAGLPPCHLACGTYVKSICYQDGNLAINMATWPKQGVVSGNQ